MVPYDGLLKHFEWSWFWFFLSNAFLFLQVLSNFFFLKKCSVLALPSLSCFQIPQHHSIFFLWKCNDEDFEAGGPAFVILKELGSFWTTVWIVAWYDWFSAFLLSTLIFWSFFPVVYSQLFVPHFYICSFVCAFCERWSLFFVCFLYSRSDWDERSVHTTSRQI